MLMKIDLNSQMLSELSNRVNVDDSFVHDCDDSIVRSDRKLNIAYDVYSHSDDVIFSVSLNFLSDGVVFAYCSCGMPDNSQCSHTEEALLFHQERSLNELKSFYGEDAFIEEIVF